MGINRLIRQRRNQTKKMVIGAVLSALSVVLLYFGSLLEIMDISVAALASFFVAWSIIELGYRYSFLIFFTTATLSLLLLPQKTPAVLYTVMIGFYPILKAFLENKLIFQKVLNWIIKICFFNGSFFLTLWICIRFLELEQQMLSIWVLALLGLGNICFVIFDIVLSRMISVYYLRFRDKWHLNLNK